METDALIAQLAGGAQPVRRMLSPWKRSALWLVAAIVPLVIVLALHGVDPGVGSFLADRRLVIEEIAIFATAVSAAIAAFASTVPGQPGKWLWLPAIPLAVWLLTLGEGCIADWMSLGPPGLALRLDTGCLLPMLLIGIVPAIVMIVMLRRGAPLYPRVTLVLGTLATAAIANCGLRLFHFGDISLMVLVWHFGMLILFLAIAAGLAPQVLRWKIATPR